MAEMVPMVQSVQWDLGTSRATWSGRGRWWRWLGYPRAGASEITGSGWAGGLIADRVDGLEGNQFMAATRTRAQ